MEIKKDFNDLLKGMQLSVEESEAIKGGGIFCTNCITSCTQCVTNCLSNCISVCIHTTMLS